MKRERKALPSQDLGSRFILGLIQLAGVDKGKTG